MKALKLSLFLAGIAVLASGISNEPAEAHVAAAADTSETISINLEIRNNAGDPLLGDGDVLHLHYWGDNVQATTWPGVEATNLIDTTDPSNWKVTLPAGASWFIINDNNGNQTQDIRVLDDFLGGRKIVDGISPTYCLDGLVTWDGADKGKIRSYIDLKREYSYSPNYFRYWLDRNGQESGTPFFVYGLGTDEEIMVPATGYAPISTGENPKYWAYFDVPVEAINTQYSIRFSGDDRMSEPAANCRETNWLPLTVDTIHKIHRISWGSENPWPIQVSEGTLAEYEISAEFFGQYVLPGYFTCLPSEVNGYLAASEIRANWMTSGDGKWYIYNELSSVTIDDYAVATTGVEDYNEYYQTAEKVPGTNAQAKLDLMLQLEAAHDGVTDASVTALFSEPKNIAGITAWTLVLVSILGFSVFYFVRRRKHASN